MRSASGTLISRWLRPNATWTGPTALAPVVTCRRILDVVLWFLCPAAVYVLVMFYATSPQIARSTPPYWVVCALTVPTVVATIFRGLPFQWRYLSLVTCGLAFDLGAMMEIGPAPNLAYQNILLIALTTLFFGMRPAITFAVTLLGATTLIAGAWVAGIFPCFLAHAPAASPFVDYTRAAVWARVVVNSFLYQMVLVLLMRYVLRDLSDALHNTNSALQKLAVEQEYRARAEEGRLKAEVSVRVAQKFEALGRLASGVAHDVNNALTVIKCWSSFLVEEKRDQEVVEAMGDIRRATENAEQLTHHLLAFSRAEPGRRQVVDLSGLVRVETKTLSRLLPKNVTVVADAAQPAYVRLGSGQLQELILNLAINARDAMTSGGRLTFRVREVSLKAGGDLKSGRYAQLEVEDTGSGMTEEIQGRIFEPFFTTKAPDKGTGLGLAMVYGLVSGAGGDIQVRSRLNVGTCFTIRLPLTRADDATQTTAPIAITAPLRCRVLIVEPEPTIRAMLERVLAREGFPVIAAARGNEALQAVGVSGGRFGLVITAGGLPEATAAHVIEGARAAEPDCRVIVLSDSFLDEDLRQGILEGKYHVLGKPFDAGQIRGSVNVALAGARAGTTP
ncbi:MAG TPA: ATP-binding protein [Candidatus Didemnitutus sp.]|jgi:signal transduction histidine kinase/ActR/RegA family two-component response regulator